MSDLFMDSFDGSTRTKNAVRVALECRSGFRLLLPLKLITDQMAMSLTGHEVGLQPNAGKRTVDEFLEWKARKVQARMNNEGEMSISHWGVFAAPDFLGRA